MTIPATKDSNRLLAKKKSLLILDFKLMMLPCTVNTVVLEHVCLKQTTHIN